MIRLGPLDFNGLEFDFAPKHGLQAAGSGLSRIIQPETRVQLARECFDIAGVEDATDADAGG